MAAPVGLQTCDTQKKELSTRVVCWVRATPLVDSGCGLAGRAEEVSCGCCTSTQDVSTIV